MKKVIFISVITVFLSSNVFASYSSVVTPPAKTKHIGIAYEERSVYFDTYLFYNQLIDDHYFYELRAYYIHNFLVHVQNGSLPPMSSQQNVDGTGGVGIFGYQFSVNNAVKLMPFLRLQYLTNTVAAYQDSLGNSIDSETTAYYAGLKMTMKITDPLSMGASYYGGYQTSYLYGAGVFATPSQAIVNAWASTLEFSLPYKITPSWIFTPYIQFIITSNEPNGAALNASTYPMKQNGNTTTNTLYAVRLAYAF